MQKSEIDVRKFEESAEFLKAIGHPVRLCIIRGIYEKGKCNVNFMQCCLEMPQSTISTHLAKLRRMGILTYVKDGNEVYYQVKDKKAIEILKTLKLI